MAARSIAGSALQYGPGIPVVHVKFSAVEYVAAACLKST